jgi:methyl-accepting chemotaxis protein
MTNDQLKKLETLHIEAEQTAAAFHAIAIRAEAGSETAKQFKKLAGNAFDQANSYYQASLEAYRSQPK